MRQKIGVWIASLLLILPSAAMALGLGKIELKSALNQPLDGEIPLLSVRAKDLEHLKVKLASSTDFKRAGIERPYFLSRINFEIVENNKKYTVKLTSKDSIQEPFLNFLVEVRWSNGKMLREFTVLLDPPVTANSYQKPGAKVAQEAAKKAPAKITKKPTKPKKKTASKGVGVSKRPKFTTTSSKTSKRKSSKSQSGAASGKYSVKRGQTLWKIARKVRDKDTQSVEQMMMALYKNNPEAFSKNNINSLLAGRVLDLPSDEQVQQLNDSQAKLAVRDQARAWRKGLSSPSTGKAGKAKKGGAKAKSATTKVKPKSKGRIEIVAPSDETVTGDKSVQASGKVDAKDDKEISRLRSELAAAQKAVEEQKSKNDDMQNSVSDMQGKIKSLERLLALKDQEMAKLQSKIAGGEQPAVEVVAEEVEVKVQEPEAKGEEVKPEEAKLEGTKLEETKPVTEPAQEQKPEEVEKAEQEPVEEAKPEQLPVESKRPEPKAPVMPTDVKAEVKSTLMDDPKIWAIASGVILALLILVWIIIRSMFRRGEITDEELDAHGVSTVITSVESDDDEASVSVAEKTESQPEPQSEKQEEQVEDEEDYAEVFEEEESEEDEPAIIREADVYVAYGRTAQAVEKLEKAISENPENCKIRYKLLEVLAQSGEAEQFDKQAKAYFELINDPSDESWLEIVEMGQKLSPESPLYKEAGSIMQAEGLSIDELLGEDDLDSDDLGMDLSDDLLEEEDTGLSVGETFEETQESDRDIIEELSEGEELEDVESDEFDMSLDFDVAESEPEAVPHEDEQKLAYETSDSDIEELADLEFELDSIDEEVLVENDAGDEIGAATVELNGGMEEPAYLEDEIATEEEGTDSLDDLSIDGLDIDDIGGDLDADLAELDDLDDLSDLDIGDDDLGLDDFESEEDLLIEDNDAVGTKLDLAKAYIDMGDSDGAKSILSEVVAEGSDEQKKEAQELIDKL